MRIQLSAPHKHLGLKVEQLEVNGHRLRCDWNRTEVDAMIGFWEFTDEFLSYHGPKVFYCCEPSFYFNGFRASKRLLRSRLSSLRADEFAWHFHDDQALRVEHHTGPVQLGDAEGTRVGRAATVVGNLGHPLARNPGRKRRLEFILESGCDIFGSSANWTTFRRHPWSRKGAPPTYRGPCPYKLDTLRDYQVCVCFENSSEPLYFTEKFPDAVRAGCVPIYHAPPTVKERFLNGAIWVDPADFDWNPTATMEAALSLTREEVAENNEIWMKGNPALAATSLEAVYARLAGLLDAKAHGRLVNVGPAMRTRLKDEY